MTVSTYTQLLEKPQQVSKSQTEDLKAVVDAFPYFQSARALYLKGLKNTDSFKYNQELKTTAAYTTDRSILFEFITSKKNKQNITHPDIKQNTSHLLDINVDSEDISTHKIIIVDQDLNEQIEATAGVLSPKLFQPKIEISQVANFELDTTEEIIEKTVTEKNKIEEENIAEKNIEEGNKKEVKTDAPEVILGLGKPLEFDKKETHSFNEWLSLSRYQPINRYNKTAEAINETVLNESDDNKNLSQAKKFELIEKFIANSPKLKAKTAKVTKHNIAKAQMIKPEALMTETLARIYLEQKNFKKAIQSYRVLSLKYPEKSGYFADQIKAIKQLQEYNNKE